MFEFGHHVLLVACCAALGASGLRVAAACGADGLLRVVAAAPLAVAAAVAHALVLGRLGLSSSALVLAVLAFVTWGLVRFLVPAPRASLATAGAAWWTAAPLTHRLSVGAAAGAWVSWVLWQLRFPHLDVDGLLYHLPLVVSWMPDGDAGAATSLIEGLPVGNYPLTNEVALAWALGIAHGLAWVSVWSPLMWALTAVAAWVGLRTLEVPRLLAGFTIAAILTLPLVVAQLGAPLTDLPALAWATTTAALCAASISRPTLLAPALVAAALAVGTKTTPAPLLILALGVALWRSRAVLRPLAVRALMPAVALGTLVGGAWMIRNTVSHGWPLWPFMSGPTGDDLPSALVGFDASFLDDPAGMLRGRTPDYTRILAGGVVMLVGLLVLPLLALVAGRRRRSGLAAGGVARNSSSTRDPGGRRALPFAAAALFGIFAWANAPYTGIQESTFLAVGAVRYLLPALACAALAIAVAGASGPAWLRRTATGVLGFAVLVSVGRIADLGAPFAPTTATLVPGAAVGALVVLVGSWLARTGAGRSALPRLGGGAAVLAITTALVAVVVLAHRSQQYLLRHTAVPSIDTGILGYFLGDPDFLADETRRVSMGPATLGTLAGERLQHELDLIPAGEPCSQIRARLDDGWVIAQVLPDSDAGRRIVACMRGIELSHRDTRYIVWSGSPPG